MKFLHLFAGIIITGHHAAAAGSKKADYPDCDIKGEGETLGDGKCDTFAVFTDHANGVYWEPYDPNVEGCGWDGGDCLEFNKLYPGCQVSHVDQIGNGVCVLGENEGLYYNIERCGFDGGDCDWFNEQYPDCPLSGWTEGSTILVGDGVCDRPWHQVNSPECGFEGGDCVKWNEEYPNCDSKQVALIGDGTCQPFASFNTERCNYDGGDCEEFNQKYPDCKAIIEKVFAPAEQYTDQFFMGHEDEEGGCIITSPFNVEECGFHDGKCVKFNQNYPSCSALLQGEAAKIFQETGEMEVYGINNGKLGNGLCNPGLLNTPECKFDGGDCDEFNKRYPTCNEGNLAPMFNVAEDTCETESADCGYGDCEWSSCDACSEGTTAAQTFAIGIMIGIAGIAVAAVF